MEKDGGASCGPNRIKRISGGANSSLTGWTRTPSSRAKIQPSRSSKPRVLAPGGMLNRDDRNDGEALITRTCKGRGGGEPSQGKSHRQRHPAVCEKIPGKSASELRTMEVSVTGQEGLQ